MDFIAAAAGFAFGFMLLACFLAPALRRLGVYTAGDFLARRFGGAWVRLANAGVAFFSSFFLLLAHLKIASVLLETLTGLSPQHALWLAAGMTALPVLAGGMRSLTWTQAVQYFVAVLACLAPAGYLTVQGAPAETVIAGEFGALLIGNLPTRGAEVLADFALPALFMGLAAAALPHVMARALAAHSERGAATSMVWGLMFSVTLVTAGLVLSQVFAGMLDVTAPVAEGNLLQLAALFAALPAVLAGLVVAGALAALLAVGQAALFSASTALSHDVWDEMFDPRGPEGRRIVIARLILIGVLAIAAAMVPLWRIGAADLLQWGLAFAAAGGLAPLILGLVWRRCNDIGALAGIVAGFGFTFLAFLLELGSAASGGAGLAGLGPAAAAIFGVAAAFAVTISVSLVMPAPDQNAAKPPNGITGNGARLPMQERPA